VIAGEGTARKALEALITQFGVRDRVHLLGNREDTGDVMDALDIFVLTSDSEGMSNAMLEAMARGLPVVTTDVSGARDALAETPEYAAAGLITDFDDESVVSAITRLAGDADLRASLGESGRARARIQFSPTTILSRWEEFLAPQDAG
jgi:glycosyltransferase involved in cell wall biosynthesis